ncbi:hypothetical protein KAFR_0C00240 [Kazachstania africana CBS 2517]|uniref:Uncharacterized protein n=1 Tax=Kazachstania africana (strain ATCC 22294 / BCRC 22015 / CBS 2517 / CECT 1963 / NBRC 1671 / NRRL Y-8276) TaxID=1071382 RepID=H2ARM0_KAZAF|nr:hypothetical protein KAFR_0C00240 [Kazachstania africana CBS 2517]CCF57020.1 hypothetical protein KAFR_0C00240 [Kazachstania africana CBS 2517]
MISLRHYHLLRGTALSKSIVDQIKTNVVTLKRKYPDFSPTLKIIQVGNKSDSSTYIRMKQRASKSCLITTIVEKLPLNVSEDEVLARIEESNSDSAIDGIIVQLPLPKLLNEQTITDAILPSKDVDGLTVFNSGQLAKRGGHPFFLPCTPNGIMELLRSDPNIIVEGKVALVIGRSDIVGNPLATMLRKENATIISCHSKTKNIERLIKLADILVSACGIPNFVKGEWLKKDAVIIDVGINYVKDKSKKSKRKLVGDVDIASVKNTIGFLTPVPGGVGPMTVASLMNNVFIAAKNSIAGKTFHPYISPLPLPNLENNTKVSDFQISKLQKPKRIEKLAEELGILPDELELFGHFKAKISTSILERLKMKQNGKYVLVAGITPTPFGEGKSATTIGLAQALTAHLGIPSIANLRQPSMGPIFGMKGGAAGGGFSQAIPTEEFNLHLTGDMHAITAATNLLASAVDTRYFHESTQKDITQFFSRLVTNKRNGKQEFTPFMLRRLRKLGISKKNPNELSLEEIRQFSLLNINPDSIIVNRVIDMNDRMLRKITLGQAPSEKGLIRVSRFEITAASELMAILTLSKSIKDLRKRAGEIVVAFDYDGNPITAEDIGCAGAVAALLKDSMKPTLMQTLEGTPVLVHAGPFANISIGSSSIMADLIGLKLMGQTNDENSTTGFAVTEAGFDFSMGGERFLDIKCRSSSLIPNVVVLVATLRALKMHGGGTDVKPGQPIPKEYMEANTELVKKGLKHLKKQIDNVKEYGIPCVVALNRFETDTEEEFEVVRQSALKAGAFDVINSNHYAEGGKGAVGLAHAVVNASQKDRNFHFLYNLEDSFEEKVRKVVAKLYGGQDISMSKEAENKMKKYETLGYGNLPICIAKTQYSLSADPKLKGTPNGFIIPIKDIKLSAGAGYIQVLTEGIQTMPGLPTRPGFMDMEINEKDEIEGLF